MMANPTLERTRASRFARAEFVPLWRLARAAHGDRSAARAEWNITS